ncbi:O-methyltransferase [Devosia sp.]|uniref:O-methyltransferase n=1 Tax=Devosia sp. TaxID=1871048 RepID=UPI003BAC47CE
MDAEIWSQVDAYIADKLIGADDPAAALAANAAAGLRPMDVSPAQGKFLSLLVRMTGARRVLEVGTLGGYSTIWMARALPKDGELVTLEYEPHHAEVAARNIAAAGLSDRVTIHIGAAAETLPVIVAASPEPFDLVFIDADKPSNTIYLDWAIKLSRPGTVIVLDNVVRDGRVIDEANTDPSVLGTRAAFDMISTHPRLSASALQTVGAKGWDGFAIMIVD